MRLRLHRVAVLALLLLSPARVAGQATSASGAEVRLRPGDAVRLAVQDDATLWGEFPVLADGTVLFPTIGLVRVTHMDFAEVAAAVRASYARELVGQAVVVVPLLRVAVTGEVRSPGVLLVDPTYGWAELIARAGGTQPTAARDRVIVIRSGEEHELRRSGLALPTTLVVQSGDELYVPRRGWVADNLPILIGSATSVLVAAVTTLLVR